MVGQRCLLQYQLPWLENIELVDVSLPQIRNEGMDAVTDELLENCKMIKTVDMGGDGWGSNEATQMVLTNLFYITAKVRYGFVRRGILTLNFHKIRCFVNFFFGLRLFKQLNKF